MAGCKPTPIRPPCLRTGHLATGGNAAPHVSWPVLACLDFGKLGNTPKKSGSGQVEVRHHEAGADSMSIRQVSVAVTLVCSWVSVALAKAATPTPSVLRL